MRLFIPISIFLSICLSSYSNDSEKIEHSSAQNFRHKQIIHYQKGLENTSPQRFKHLRIIATVAAYVATVYGVWKFRKHPFLKAFTSCLPSASPLFFLTLNASALVIWSNLLLSSDLGMNLTETVMGHLSQQNQR